MIIHRIPWFSSQHEMLTTSKELLAFKPFTNYIDLIKSGEQPVSEDIWLLVNDIIPMLLEKMDNNEIYFDKTMVNQVLTVPSKAFPYTLFDWEAFVICFMFGFRWVEDDVLVYDEYFLYMARGAGKNGFLSWVIFALISKINEVKKYNIVVSASSERQAKTSFIDISEVLAEIDPDKRVFKRTYTEIEHKATRSNFQYLSSNGSTADGLRLGMVYLDEVHAISDYAMLNVLRSALGKIPDARTTITTTDGYIRGSVLDQYKELGHEILTGKQGVQYPRDDERHSSMFPFMHHIDDLSEVKSKDGWAKANPSVLYIPTLLAEYRKNVKAMDKDAELNLEFHCKRVNFPKEDNRFTIASLEELQETRHKDITDYVAATGDNAVYGVVDYSETTDLTSCGAIGYDTGNEQFYYTHKSFITHASESAGIINPEILRLGHAEGKLETVYMAMVDPSIVVNYFNELSANYFVTTIYIDQYKSTILKPALEAAGYKVEVIRTDMKSETQISPVLDKVFKQNRLHVGEDSLFRWAVRNLYKSVLSKGIRFDKIEPKKRKTDPASAFITGLIGIILSDSVVPDNDMSHAGHMIT